MADRRSETASPWATPEQIDRLPKWARRVIEQREARVRELEAALAVGPEGSDTFLEPYTRERQPLGRRQTVAFVFPDGSEVTCRLMGNDAHNLDAGEVPHLSVSARDGCLVIVPQSSNVLRVRADIASNAY